MQRMCLEEKGSACPRAVLIEETSNEYSKSGDNEAGNDQIIMIASQKTIWSSTIGR